MPVIIYQIPAHLYPVVKLLGVSASIVVTNILIQFFFINNYALKKRDLRKIYSSSNKNQVPLMNNKSQNMEAHLLHEILTILEVLM